MAKKEDEATTPVDPTPAPAPPAQEAVMPVPTPRELAVKAINAAHAAVAALDTTSGREKALTLTKIEEAGHWFNRVH